MNMKLTGLAVVVAFVLLACTQQSPTVKVAEKAPLGTYLTDAGGRTVYIFVENQYPCTGQCLRVWPRFTVQGQPDAGPGVNASLLGTTTHDDGSVQVTHNGHGLHYFDEDQKPGDTFGQGIKPPDEDAFGGGWSVISPAGTQVVTP